LNHHQFQKFLKSLDSEYNDVTFFAEVRWLTRAKMLKRVFDLMREIQLFFASKSKSIPEFEDKEWVSDFAFLVDIVTQGKGQLIINMYDFISAFQMKLGLWEQQLRTKIFTNFPTLLLQPEVTQMLADKYASLISDLNREFENRYQDFIKHRVLFATFATPFSIDANLLPGILQMEHCEMCCDAQFKEKFNQVSLEEFYKTYLDEEKYPAFYEHAQWMISLFGNTYTCEQLFSRMRHIKSQMRTRITDEHLESCLRIATTSIVINIDALSSDKQNQTSHLNLLYFIYLLSFFVLSNCNLINMFDSHFCYIFLKKHYISCLL
jgi:hypothetical protein